MSRSAKDLSNVLLCAVSILLFFINIATAEQVIKPETASVNGNVAATNTAAIARSKNTTNIRFLVPDGFENLDDSREINIYFHNKIIAYAKVSGTDSSRFITLQDGSLLLLNKYYDCNASPEIRKLLPCEQATSSAATPLAQFSLSNDPNKAEYASLIPSPGYASLFYDFYEIAAEQLNNAAKNNIPEYITESSVNHLSGRFGYSSALSHRFNDGKTYGSANINALLGYANYSFEIEPYINISQYGQADIRIDSFVGSYINKGMRLQSGVKSRSQISNIRRAKNILPAGNVAGIWLGSFAETKNKKQSGTMKPIEVYLPSAGKVEVFKGDQLLFTGRFQAGSLIIPRESFPIGIYDVVIKRAPDSMAKLPELEHRVINSRNEEYLTFSVGAAQYGDKYTVQSTNFYDANYDNTYLSLEGAAQIAAGLSLRGSTSWLNNVFYGSLGLNTKRFSFVEFDLEAVYASDHSWSAGFYTETNLNDTLKGLSASLSSSYTEKRENKSNNLSLHANYRLDTSYLQNVRVSYYKSNYESLNMNNLNYSAPWYQQQQQTKNLYPDKSSFSDLSLNIDTFANWFGMPVYLTGNIGKDNINDFRIGFAVNIDFGKTIPNYTISARLDNIQGQNSSNIYIRKHTVDTDYIDSLQASIQNYKKGYGFGAQAAVKTALFNTTVALDSQYNKNTDKITSQANLWLNGGFVFAGSNYSFTPKQHLRSGYIFEIENNDDKDIKINASVSRSQRSFLMNGSSYVLPLKTFSRHDIYINSLGAVLPEEQSRFSDVFYPGNFKLVKITPRKTIEVAGMYQLQKKADSEILIKNHESEVLLKNHESQTSITEKTENAPLFFQLTVSKKHPTLDIFKNGEFMCSKNIEDELNVADLLDRHFVYLTNVSCPAQFN